MIETTHCECGVHAPRPKSRSRCYHESALRPPTRACLPYPNEVDSDGPLGSWQFDECNWTHSIGTQRARIHGHAVDMGTSATWHRYQRDKSASNRQVGEPGRINRWILAQDALSIVVAMQCEAVAAVEHRLALQPASETVSIDYAATSIVNLVAGRFELRC